jgi:nickel/cobalt exporter
MIQIAHMRRRTTTLCFAALVLATPALAAHPLGLSSINRYAGVKLHAREVEVDYLVDYAEIPAYTEIERLDADHDGAVTAAERERYVASFLTEMLPTLEVHVDGARVALHSVGHGIEAPQGQNGLSTLRLAIELRGALPGAAARHTVRVIDRHFAERGGWRELAAEPTSWARVVSSSLPPSPSAGRGLAYPTDPDDPRAVRVRPPRHDDATFVFESLDGATPDGAAVRVASERRSGASTDGARLVALLRDPHRSVGFILFALALAFGLGAGHALSPGHGKTIVGASLLGSRAKARHALLLGLTVTVTHTASVFAMGFLALAIERYVGSEKLLRTLELSSGALVAAVALSQLPERLRRMQGAFAPKPVAHDHDHAHHHDHAHDHDHGHSHALPEELTLRSLVALGVSGGIVPCPGALVVLLAAIGLHQVAFGLAMLVAFSMGLATVLSAIGLVFVLARSRFERLSTDGRLLRALPVLSSCAVLVLGVVIAVRALVK